MKTKKARKLAVGAAKLVTPILGIAVAGATLMFMFSPGAKPDPKADLAASMEIQSVEPKVTFGEFLTRAKQHVQDLTAEDLAVRGHLLSVKVRVQGRAHSSLRLTQAVYSARSRRLLPGQEDTADSTLTIETPDDQWIQPVFVPDAAAAPVFVHLSLYDGDVVLAFVDSKTLNAGETK